MNCKFVSVKLFKDDFEAPVSITCIHEYIKF